MSVPSSSFPAPVAADVREVRVDDEGITFCSRDDVVLDVLFDGRRVWSFWLQRDSEPRGVAVRPERHVAWPRALRRFLDGSTRLGLVDHVAGAEVFAADVTLGSGEGRIEVVDGKGRPMGLDKSQRLYRLFESRDSAQTAPLLDAVEVVLAALREAGIEGFVAYGTLLGAVREGRLLGHDSDVDLGYVSCHEHPADVVAESFRVQRRLVEMGFVVTRYSGVAVKVHVPEADGAVRGLDVFGGFMRPGSEVPGTDRTLYLMGEVGAPYREEWVFPLTTVELEGRPVPAPADPDRLLVAMYGESWRVPDPAYEFTTPFSTSSRLNGWFRGIRVGQGRGLGKKPFSADEPSGFVRWVRERESDLGRGATYVDVGCGYGTDVAWLGRQGVSAWGIDAHYKSYRRMRRLAAAEELPVTYRWVNLAETRSLLAAAAELSRVEAPRVVLARHVLDAVDGPCRANIVRLGRLLARDGGALYLQVQTTDERNPASNGLVSPLDLDDLAALIHAQGGEIVERHDLDEAGPDADAASNIAPNIARWVVSW